MQHRGRIQAQGKNLEESESWAQQTPPTKQDGLNMLQRLINKLSKRDYDIRKICFEKAEQFIKNAPTPEGWESPVHRSYSAQGNSPERVDIEIITGNAFTQ